jgi:hypothetical protein
MQNLGPIYKTKNVYSLMFMLVINKSRQYGIRQSGRESSRVIYKLVRNESIPIDLQLKMFDSMIEPILLYGSEVWGSNFSRNFN